ncbi:MAG: tRNA (guanosine(46)-N7)-methyltransferase TrmB [Lachnospirales bacterium]
MRQRNKKWVENEMETNIHLVKEPTVYKGKWQEIFDNDNPIHLEIGCGKGDFVVGMAMLHRNINFIAFEKEEQVIAMAIRKLREKEETDNIELNVLFINDDAKDLRDFFGKGELERIYLNFSDPWRNRKKWYKRRLSHRGFLEIYKDILEEKGSLFMKTDNQNLFEFSLNELSHCDFKLSNITFDLHNSEFEGNVVTEYETKFSNAGMPIYRLEAYKRFGG